jgi:kumamolisin
VDTDEGADMADSPQQRAVPDGRRAVPGSGPAGAPSEARSVDPGYMTTVTVYLRGDDPPEGARLTREEWAAAHGASDADVAEVVSLASGAGLTVVAIDRARRSVQLSGPVASIAEAFAVEVLGEDDGDGGVRVFPAGPLSVPAALDGAVTAVVGLDERPRARTHLRRHRRSSTASGLTPIQVAEAYDFPPGTDGAGQTVALIELGGGYREADLQAYFAGLGLATPAVTAVAVDGGANAPGAASGPDGEVMLDIEVVGAVASKAAIAVYFTPNTDQGFVDALSTAVHDTTNRPSVISISWGGPESSYAPQTTAQMEAVLTQAASLGVTVTVASGDNGSTDGVNDGAQHVDFPASAPHALACGGTRLTLSSSGAPSAEIVWDDLPSGGASGGGISALFPVPAYQSAAGVPPSANPGGGVGRGVPDVSGDASPETGYAIRVDGQTEVIGGTSAVAPLWAALVARCNQSLGRDVGDLHQVLYANPQVCRDIISGSNGAYSAGPGWDACTGLGSPDGVALLEALRAQSAPPAIAP